MQDIVYMALLVVVFAVLALFVVACDHIIGPDETALAESAPRTPAGPTAEGSTAPRAA
ncbi:MAG TPA: hypothetical protein VIJ69_07945 [Actinomycetota bacterium]|jgi:hypothetical protein